jgi:hypothetical protein
MADLERFREQVTIFRKRQVDPATGRPYTLNALARSIGLSVDELSHRLRGTGRSKLTREMVLAIVRALAEWDTLTWDEVVDLLTLMDYPLDQPDWQTEFQHFLVLPDHVRVPATKRMPALLSQPIGYYTCFISYSSHDQTFAEHLYLDLQKREVRCWFAPEDLKIGAKLRPSIDESIRFHDKLLIVLSEHSVASQWVEQEVETALEKERKEERTVLFPIRLDNTVMEIAEGCPALIRNTRNIGDFTHWQQLDAYQKALGRLLRDLKADV